MPYYPKLRGEQVYLSPIDPDDAPTFVAWLNDMEVAKNLKVSSMMVSLANERDFLVQLASRQGYAIVDAASDTLLGTCSLENIDELHRRAEAGIFIGAKERWGQGLGSDALRTLVRYGFDYLNLASIYLTVFGFNQRAIRSYERVGFQHAGRLRNALQFRGQRCDLLYMDIIPADLAPSGEPCP